MSGDLKTLERISQAVIVQVGDQGMVLWHKGHDIECMIDSYSYFTDELELDAPNGISVWEGYFRATQYETEAVGKFRQLTKEEIELVRVGKNPL